MVEFEAHFNNLKNNHKKHKKVPKSLKIAKFWNKVVYGGYVPAPYTGYRKSEQK